MRKILIYALVAVFLAAAAQSFAENEIKPKRIVDKRTIQGEVAGIQPESIAITYETNDEQGTSKDILLQFDDGMLLQNKKALKQIRAGDIVAVEYNEITEDGSLTRRATKVIFVKAAAKKAESSMLDSESAEPVQEEEEEPEGEE